MNITKKENGDALEVALQGRLDTMTAPELERELKSCLGGPDGFGDALGLDELGGQLVRHLLSLLVDMR